MYKRPKLKIPFSRSEKIIEIIAAVGMLLNIIVIAAYWNKLPDRFATHFDFYGRPNGWGSRDALVILPMITIALYFGLSLLEKYPESYNYIGEINESNAEGQYKYARRLLIFIKTELMYFFGYIQWVVIQGALKNSLWIGPGFTIVFLGVVFGTVGYFIYKSTKLK